MIPTGMDLDTWKLELRDMDRDGQGQVECRFLQRNDQGWREQVEWQPFADEGTVEELLERSRAVRETHDA